MWSMDAEFELALVSKRRFLETNLRRTYPVFPLRRYWVTDRKTRDIYIRRRRVPLSEVYSSISENFHLWDWTIMCRGERQRTVRLK